MTRSADLAAAVGRTVEVLAPGAVATLAEMLRTNPKRQALKHAVSTNHYQGAVEELLDAWGNSHNVAPEALAFALECAQERQAAAQRRRVSIVWTGPATDAVPVRRSDQALLQLVGSAKARLIVVSFAVYKVPVLAQALVAAAQRGVDVDVVVESELESGGKVNYEMAAALGSEVAKYATIYTWPADKRPKTATGKRASLHAKCAVADGEWLLVSSANLTEFAFTLNMELGLLVEGGDVPARVHAHLVSLIQTGVLQPVASDK